MRIAVVSFAAEPDPVANARVITEYAERATAEGAELLLAPEAAMVPFSAGRLDRVAAEYAGTFEQMITAAADANRIAIVAGMFRLADIRGKYQRVSNSLLLARPGEAPVFYDKIHLYDAFGYRESDTVRPGNEIVVAEVAGTKLGLTTCYDLRFPEHFIALARGGAEIILVATSWQDGPGKREQLELLTRARALDSTSFVVTADQNGVADSARPLGVGFAACASPFGELVAELPEAPRGAVKFGCFDIDLASVSRARRALPLLGERPEYSG